MATLEFRILGPLEVFRAGLPIDVGPRQQRALLALLVVEANRVVSFDRLVDELWGEEPPSGARSTVQAYVSKLRRALDADGPAAERVLATQDPGYVLRVDPETVDARRFERLATEGRAALDAGDAETAAARLGDALALWRGPALADFVFQSAAPAADGDTLVR